MSNEELEDDVVLAKFINYMQKALYHMRLNYYRDYEKIKDYEFGHSISSSSTS